MTPIKDVIATVGQTYGREPCRSFGIKTADRLHHMAIFGQTGTGKSTLLAQLMQQDIRADRERLLNGVLELYDFVLGSLLDAGMTQKQNVIFRYITRLLIHIPGATIHTLRELLEEDGYQRYQVHIAKLQGSARAFFETEFQGKEFASTRKQVLRRLTVVATGIKTDD